MLIAEETVAKVRDASDIVEVISESVPNLKRAGKDWKGLCPFHQEKTPSFMVSPAKGIFHCFGCGIGGDVFKFIMEMDKCTYPEAIHKLAERRGIPVRSDVSSGRYKQQLSRKKSLVLLLERAAKFYHKTLVDSEEGQDALRYLLDRRKLALETIQKYRLGWAPAGGQALYRTALKTGCTESDLASAGLIVRSQKYGKVVDWFRGRVIFPIFDGKGQVLGFGGRILETPPGAQDPPPKYLNSPETEIFQKGKNLYGFYHGVKALREKNEALIVEGYMDVIACHQAGVEYAVAPLGTSLTQEQCQLLRRYVERVSLLFDSDNAGRTAAARGAEMLLDYDYLPMIAQVPGQKDADEFLQTHSPEEFEAAVLKPSISFPEFKLRSLIADPAAVSPVDKAIAARALIPIFLKIRNEILRTEVVRQVANRLDVSAESLYAEMKKKKDSSFRAPKKESQTESPAASVQSHRVKAEEELLALVIGSVELRRVLDQESRRADVFSDPALAACHEVLKLHPEAPASEVLANFEEAPARRLRPLVLRYADLQVGGREVFESILKRLREKNDEQERKELEKRIIDHMKKGQAVPEQEISRYQHLMQMLKGTPPAPRSDAAVRASPPEAAVAPEV